MPGLRRFPLWTSRNHSICKAFYVCFFHMFIRSLWLGFYSQDVYGLEKLATEGLCKHYTKDFEIECRLVVSVTSMDPSEHGKARICSLFVGIDQYKFFQFWTYILHFVHL